MHKKGLRIATAIEHQQWFSATYGALGHLYLLLLEPDLAISALDTGLVVAQTLGSSFLEWVSYCVSGSGIYSQKRVFKRKSSS